MPLHVETYNRTWDALQGDHDPYQIFQQMTLSVNYATVLSHEGADYKFQWKGDCFSAYSVLEVTNLDNNVSRCYRRGWEVPVIGYALEEITEGWHLPGTYLRHRLPSDEFFPDAITENVDYV